MTQRDRILAALRRGPVNTVAFCQAPVIDGGKPILRIAARIFDLQQQGYLITTRRRSNATVDYVLVGGVERSDSEPQETVEAYPVEPAPDIGPSTAAASLSAPTDCTKEGAESDAASRAPSEVASDSLFPVEGFVSRPDYRDEQAA